MGNCLAIDAFYPARLRNAAETVAIELYREGMSHTHLAGLVPGCRQAFWRGFAGVCDYSPGTPESAWALTGFDAAAVVYRIASEFGVDEDDLRGEVVTTHA
ncbi:hypothetical protein [Nocardia sp. NPDC051570]|uniref:hypothetical protein n=1 Tax=Nocardia sp. NPDC051570 TaxID=3364324 RepID=UPI0037A561C8